MSEKTAVFYFSGIPYNFLYQRPQQLLREWRANFADSYEFYYVEFPAVRRFIARRSQRLKQSFETLLLEKHTKNAEETFVLTWLGVPRLFRGSTIRNTLSQRCGKTQKKVAIVASTFWGPFVSKDDFDLVCYDYLDEVVSTVSDFYPVRQQHKKLLANSDIVFVTAQNLREDALSIVDEKDVVTVSNGTDADFFEKNKDSHQVLDYVKKNKKTVGYVGVLSSSWTDFDLIYATAQELPKVDFVLVGHLDPRAKSYVRGAPKNVFMLGVKKYAQIPSYLNIFDVCIIPFKQGPIADSTDPVKLYEYFSLGKPVVATALKELKRFDDGHLLRVAKTQDEFVEAICAFLKYDTEAWQESRRQIARQNSWLSKATLMITNIERKLAEQ